MTVSASDVTFLNLGFDFVDAATVCHHAAYCAVLLPWIAVVKLKHADVVFTAVNARVLKQVGPHPHPRSDLPVVVLCPLST
jgi:hypothetical protein